MTFTSSVLHQMTELVQKINEHMHGFKNSFSARITLNKTFLNSSIKDNRCILIFFFHEYGRCIVVREIKN